MVKKGQLQVSKMDSPHQGEPRDPDAPKIKTGKGGGSHSQRRAKPKSEGSRG